MSSARKLSFTAFATTGEVNGRDMRAGVSRETPKGDVTDSRLVASQTMAADADAEEETDDGLKTHLIPSLFYTQTGPAPPGVRSGQPWPSQLRLAERKASFEERKRERERE